MVRIVVIEPFGQLRHHRFRIRLIGQFGVVPFQCFHEALRHPVALWTGHRCGHWLEPQLLGKAPGLGCRVAAAVVSEPFNGLGRCSVGAEPFLYCLHHQIAQQSRVDSFGP